MTRESALALIEKSYDRGRHDLRVTLLEVIDQFRTAGVSDAEILAGLEAALKKVPA